MSYDLDEYQRFAQLQADAVFRLASDPLTGQVPVILQKTGDIGQQVLEALGALNESATGKSGACIVVLLPDFDVTNPNVSGVDGEMVLTARCLDMPLLNDTADGTGLDCGVLAMRALRVLGNWQDHGVAKVVQPKGTAIQPYVRDLANGVRGFDVTVRAPSGVSGGGKVATPGIAVALIPPAATAAVLEISIDTENVSGQITVTVTGTPTTVVFGDTNEGPVDVDTGTIEAPREVTLVAADLGSILISAILGNVVVVTAGYPGADQTITATALAGISYSPSGSVTGQDAGEDGTEVTLSCATSGAAIYYTADGSYPGSGNPAATLYTVPFNPASGATIRAGAQKTGEVPSDPQFTTIP